MLYRTTNVGGDLSAYGGAGCGIMFSPDPVGNEEPNGVALKLTAVAPATAAGILCNTGTEICTKVPAGATTGYVTVTTPSGVLTSNVPFRVP